MDTQKIIIHHLSDIHFGVFEQWPVRSDKNCKNIAERASPSFSSQYIKYLKYLEVEKQPHFVVISGDFAVTGDMPSLESGAKYCKEIIKYMRKVKESEPLDRLIVVPGNHDVDWNEEHQGARIANFISSFRCFRTPYFSPEGASEKSSSMFYYPSFNILFWAIDSSKMSGYMDPDLEKLQEELSELIESKAEIEKIKEKIYELNRMDPGFIERKCFDEFEEAYYQMSYEKDVLDRAIKCAILHHSVSPFPIEEIKPYGKTINGGLLKKHLQNWGFDIILHGHCHEARIFYEDMDIKVERQGLHIIASGTLCGDSIGRNSFNIITIHQHHDGKFSCQVTKIKSSNTRFSEETNSEDLGQFFRRDYNRDKLSSKYSNVLLKTYETKKPLLSMLDKEVARLLPERRDAGYNKEWIETSYKNYLQEASKIHAIDIQAMEAWTKPIVYYYLSLQLTHYIKNNFNNSKWNLIFSPHVCKAIELSIENREKKYKLKLDESETFLNDPDVKWEPGEPKCEIIRILLWKESNLLDNQANLLIKIHDNFQIPLFYLNIDRLKDRSERNQYEYIIFLNDKMKKSTTKGLWIEPLNPSMEHDDLLTKGKIRGFGCPADDFEKLLSNPNIVFARDAYNYLNKD